MQTHYPGALGTALDVNGHNREKKGWPSIGETLSSLKLHSSAVGSDGKESTYNAGDLGSILGLGRSPGGEHGNPLQYSCLENPIEKSLAG